ncbi:MAG TPA: site-2 protease family protein [archaeon]|nr:site-2 protease family protein [archaeon]
MMTFHKQEIRDIILATAVLAFAFGHSSVENFLTSLFVVGVAFLSHELIGHKLVAQKFGAEAEFKAWPMGLLLAVVTSFFGFIFAAPGAVYISPVIKGKFAFTLHRLTEKEYGIVSLAGPAVNIILGAVFFAAGIYYNIGLLLFAARISFFLALFNLLPIDPLDGAKVMRWSTLAWLVAILFSGAGYLLLR